MSLCGFGNVRRMPCALRQLFARLVTDATGQDLIEYGLLASLIAVASAGAVSAFGVSVFALWSRVVADLRSYFS